MHPSKRTVLAQLGLIQRRSVRSLTLPRAFSALPEKTPIN